LWAILSKNLRTICSIARPKFTLAKLRERIFATGNSKPSGANADFTGYSAKSQFKKTIALDFCFV
jgi:hypothetical protein